MPHFITSAQSTDHITSSNDSRWNAGTIGLGKFAVRSYEDEQPFLCSMPDSNTLRIQKGEASCDGYRWSIDNDYEEYPIENGTPGYKRIDLVVAHIETAPKEDMDIRVIKGVETTGEPAAPSHIDGDLNNGDTTVEVPICTVLLDGINPQAPQMKMNVLTPYKQAWDSISQIVKASKNYTIAAGGSATVTITPTIPDGYKIVGIQSFSTGHVACNPSTIEANPGGGFMNIFNNLGTQLSLTAHMGFLCMRVG